MSEAIALSVAITVMASNFNMKGISMQFYTSPYDWALREAPTGNHTATLILMCIADTPAGNKHHNIMLKDITESLDITVTEANSHIKSMVAEGIIILDPTHEQPEDGFNGAHVLLNTYKVKAGK